MTQNSILLVAFAIQTGLLVAGLALVIVARIRCDRLTIAHRIQIARELPHVWTNEGDF